MSLEQKIMTELKAAISNKDEASLRSFRVRKPLYRLLKTSEGVAELKEEDGTKLPELEAAQDHWKYFSSKTEPTW